jgi:Family of unknown function (DUF6328)
VQADLGSTPNFLRWLEFAGMELSKKLKIALDETRMEVLGVQILIGFQFRSVFQNAFDALPIWSRYLDGVATLLMVCTLGLLLLPGPYHRIVEEGNSSGRFHALVGGIASWALAPFAVSIGLAVGITCERIWGVFGGLLAGATAGVMAVCLWYGFGGFKKRSEGNRERVMSRNDLEKVEDPGLHQKIDAMLTEARIILPGAQALLGFQLAIVLTEAFEKLEPAVKSLHGIALLLVCLSVLLLMSPAAYHRIVYAGQDSAQFHKVGSWLVILSTVPLALGLAADVFVVATKIWPSTSVPVIAAAFSLAFLVICWHFVPLVVKSMKKPTLRTNNRMPA